MQIKTMRKRKKENKKIEFHDCVCDNSNDSACSDDMTTLSKK